ncbi:MAG: S1 RNA-binding domain-containing protein, partial [Reinekea sp.]|nr:S1 RNA-binding domain-containing protein [Reinekea sp.]
MWNTDQLHICKFNPRTGFLVAVVQQYIEAGVLLDAGRFGEVLLPRRFASPSLAAGEQIDVFLYNDSEDRVVA